jgi:hypothetical protein
MHKVFQKYCSLFVLLLFLFPMVEKQLHAFEHLNEQHCTANEKHFHEAEHHCTVCDFTLTSAVDVDNSAYQYINSFKEIPYLVFIQSTNIVDTYIDIPARAPPVI